ncbi:MAG: hypothetical protein VB104_07995 [Candidatus Limiplasma sp.]|nr:hypothetical protein [Candidatus Limiplasma sp.]
MGQGMIVRRGGGAKELALRVQVGTVQPTGSAGMLWVNTATASNHWAAAVAAPASPAAGDLWVQMDAVSANVIELLRKNSTRINVLRVMQYDGSAWQAVEAYYHDGTDWTQISSTFNPDTDIAYTGTKTLLDDGSGHWRVKFLTSGVLTVAQPVLIDAFLVGGGGASSSGAGGAGAYTGTYGSITLAPGTSYPITVGAGSTSKSSAGGQTSAFSHTANGGGAHADYQGGAGGSGGGGYGNGTVNGGNAGYDGSAGQTTNGNYPGGAGQGTTTREFAEASGALYASGGPGMYYIDTANNAGAAAPGGSAVNQAGAANTGNGAGGNNGGNLAGGSGIVVIRDQRAA